MEHMDVLEKLAQGEAKKLRADELREGDLALTWTGAGESLRYAFGVVNKVDDDLKIGDCELRRRIRAILIHRPEPEYPVGTHVRVRFLGEEIEAVRTASERYPWQVPSDVVDPDDGELNGFSDGVAEVLEVLYTPGQKDEKPAEEFPLTQEDLKASPGRLAFAEPSLSKRLGQRWLARGNRSKDHVEVVKEDSGVWFQDPANESARYRWAL